MQGMVVEGESTPPAAPSDLALGASWGLVAARVAAELARKTLSTTRQGGPIGRDRGKSSGSLSRSHHRAE
jgi:hypothetical protein